MAWLHRSQLERLKEGIKARASTAHDVWNSTYREEFFLLRRPIANALTQAAFDQRNFEEYFTEPLPPQLDQALSLEISMWGRLQTQVERSDVSENDYRQLCKELREYTHVLVELLETELEMVSSCLTKHYLEVVRALRAQALGVTE